jgi:hypothetical protein
MATMKELMEYEGTETEPFIVNEPFDPYELENKTPFGTRWGGEIITLKIEHLEALKEGKYIAIDVEREYVAFLRLETDQLNDESIDISDEITRVKDELRVAERFKELYRAKWEKWEARARSLYRELHGKEAP